MITRLCEPSSELHIAEDWYRRTALDDLLGAPAERINDDRLYRALDRLLPHKQALETHLKERLGALFDLDYELLLYDVTSTYFEGQADGNGLARRGCSRDHRGDCKQLCIGLVVTRDGVPLGYEVFAGNRTDVTTIIKKSNCPALSSGLCESEAGDQLDGGGHQGLDEVPALFSGG